MKKTLTTPKGDRIAYVENGAGDPIVLIHGFTGNTSAWADTLTNLGKKYHVYAYDMLGHGETVMADNDAVGDTALADQLHDFIVGLGLENVIVIAHSLGCCVLFQYVLKYGCEHWKGAILADMTPAMNPSEDWDLIAAGGFGSRVALQAMEEDYEGYMRAFFMAGLPTEGLNEEQIEFMYQGWYDLMVPELVKKVLASCQPDYRPALEKFTVSTAYFYAAQSFILPNPDKIAAVYQERIVNAPFTLVPFDCAVHAFPEERNAEFVAQAEQFIESI